MEKSAFTDRVNRVITNHTGGLGNVSYVGFVPSEGFTAPPTEDKMWEHYAILGLERAFHSTTSHSMPPVDTTPPKEYLGIADKPATFYVVTSERMHVPANKIIECQLYNSSYAVNFTFDNGLQDIKYKTERHQGVTASHADDCRYTRQLYSCNPATAYFSLMNAIGDLLLGAQYFSRDGTYTVVRTKIGSTTLRDLPDVHSYYYFEKPISAIGNISLADALEQLFINATISLFSDSWFL